MWRPEIWSDERKRALGWWWPKIRNEECRRVRQREPLLRLDCIVNFVVCR